MIWNPRLYQVLLSHIISLILYFYIFYFAIEMYEKVPECILKCNCEKQPSGGVLKKKWC